MGQPAIPPTPAGTDLSGNTVIVTGANAGLGFEAARQFLALKASRVIIAVRNKEKGAEAVSQLSSDLTIKDNNPSATIENWQLDLDDYGSALAFVDRVKAELKELDILLNNGGVNLMNYEASKSGHERVMQVNCYSHILISLALLPLLRSTAATRQQPTHLTFTGSRGQKYHTLAKKPLGPDETVLGRFDARETYQGLFRYNDSKLAVSAFVRQLATKVPPSEVVVNNVCPGMVVTGFDKTLPFWLKPIMFVVRKAVGRDVVEGGRTLVCASAVVGQESHGKLVSNNEVDTGLPWLDEPAGQEFIRKLWSETVEDVSKIDGELKTYA